MLGQYRQMAKISPFLVRAAEEGVGSVSKSESDLSSKGNEDVLHQLKMLSEAIDKIKPSSEVSTSDTSHIASAYHEQLISKQNVR